MCVGGGGLVPLIALKFSGGLQGFLPLHRVLVTFSAIARVRLSHRLPVVWQDLLILPISGEQRVAVGSIYQQ